MLLCVLLAFLIVFAALPPAFAFTISSAELVPSFRDVDGNKVRTINLGQQTVVEVHIINNDNRVHQLVAIIEVHDQDGITEYVAWQSHTLIANETYDFGSSWVPQRGGSYEVRTLAVTDLKSPMVLSAVNVAYLIVKS